MYSKHTPSKSPNPFGEEEYNILLFGETGSGKSTLINYMTNFFKGGTLRNLRIAIPTKYHQGTEGLESFEKNIRDSTKSQTSECSKYEFRRNGVLFNFIDSPGLSDTEGTQRDDEHISKIMAAAEARGTLAAIIIVINGSNSRATTNLRHTLSLLKSSVPDILLKNLVVVMTNCTAGSANFDLKQLAPWIVPRENVFHMNNSALCHSEEVWINDEEMKEDIEHQWNRSMKSIDKLIQRLTQLGNTATNAFKEMRLNRNKIKSELHGILLEMKKLQDLHNELDESKLAQQNISNDIQKYSNYKKTKEIKYVDIEESSFFSTICSSCTKVCYENWTSTSSIAGIVVAIKPLHDVINTVGNFFQSLLGSPSCEKCRCPRSAHYDDTKRPVEKTKTVEEILHEMKEAHDQSVSKNNEMTNKISGLSSDIASLKAALDMKEAGVEKCCTELKRICSQFNLVDELNNVIHIMETDARSLTATEARTDANNRIKNIKMLVDKLMK